MIRVIGDQHVWSWKLASAWLLRSCKPVTCDACTLFPQYTGQMPCTANRPTRSRLTVNSVNESQDGHLAGDGRCEGGVLTPAAAMGMALVRRLQNAGFTFEVS